MKTRIGNLLKAQLRAHEDEYDKGYRHKHYRADGSLYGYVDRSGVWHYDVDGKGDLGLHSEMRIEYVGPPINPLWQSNTDPEIFSNDGGKTHYRLDD
jgi:hypothetical protein